MTARAELRVADVSAIESAPSEALSFDEAFRRYAPYVARIGMRIMGRTSDLEDLVQDVFLAAHRGFSRLRDPGAMKGWLATVTVRLARRRIRARKVRMFLGIERSADLEPIVDPRTPPDECALVSKVYRVLEGVPSERRIAWILHRIEGEPLERVAEACGCSLATVKRRIAAAQEAIRTAVADA